MESRNSVVGFLIKDKVAFIERLPDYEARLKSLEHGAAHIFGKSRQTTGLHRLLHGTHYPFPGPIRVSLYWPMTGAVFFTSM